MWQCRKTGRPTPEAVAAYAELLLRDDDGYPIRPAAHHRLWLVLLCDLRIQNLMIIAPPESAKTTWVISAYLGCRIGLRPEDNVILCSTAGEVAEARSLSLRGMVTTEGWQTLFPGVEPVDSKYGLKWETWRWSMAPGGVPRPGRLHASISAYGTGGSIGGARADEIVNDDLLDFDNSRTEHQRKLVTNWAHNSMLPRRKSKVGRTIVIGTAWHPDDVYQHLKALGNWVVCHTPLLSDSPSVYANLQYPDDWPYPVLGELVSPAELDLDLEAQRA